MNNATRNQQPDAFQVTAQQSLGAVRTDGRCIQTDNSRIRAALALERGSHEDLARWEVKSGSN